MKSGSDSTVSIPGENYQVEFLQADDPEIEIGRDAELTYGVDGKAVDELETEEPPRFQPARQRGLRLGSFGLVLDADLLYEIIEHARISPVPGVSRLFKGIINHRGNVVPVYDLSDIAGVIRNNWERSRLLMLNTGDEAVALIVFDLPVQMATRLPLQTDETENIPELFREHVRQIFREDGLLWYALDFDSFFAAIREQCVLGESGVSIT